MSGFSFFHVIKTYSLLKINEDFRLESHMGKKLKTVVNAKIVGVFLKKKSTARVKNGHNVGNFFRDDRSIGFYSPLTKKDITREKNEEWNVTLNWDHEKRINAKKSMRLRTFHHITTNFRIDRSDIAFFLKE